MEVGTYYQQLLELDANPEPFKEIYPTFTELSDRLTLRTVEALILFHDKKLGLPIKKAPYPGKMNKRDRGQSHTRELPEELRKVLMAYITQPERK